MTSHNTNLAPILYDIVHQYINKDGRRIDLVAVTRGPGLPGSLSSGLSTAKGLSIGLDTNFIAVHHMMLVLSRSLIDHEIIASTVDIAVGDLLDKCARHLGVTWQSKMPAAAMEAWSSDAELGDNQDWDFTIPLERKPTHRSTLAFSFSGLGSAVERLIVAEMNETRRKSLARAIQFTAFEHIIRKVILSLEQHDLSVSSLVVSGGVASNKLLRSHFRQKLEEKGFHNIELVFPPVEFCTDNAAMIAWAGYEMYQAGYKSELSALTLPKWPLNEMMDVKGWIHQSTLPPLCN
ncbi:tRNA N6-adenosine threonylcarbamoyltransferase, mitochondrial [Neolecta irregularis DAH-3]|uniref:N(6)-L-threonylcarbamoyladenine synthase n=1 Tax=Neolecta irregularis (strain DAH-3) TaxID=1198029 RepID=A0A1U7LWE2_NEOID|nr:tRNA N6-adenosine threonylcarbamoyltransferase, mitochondrial [Neolecta irregularis DAH-3]|eukprot:OLL26954.1 tRNA N6-adenosine threonylcarbamoyltransferase, mitochondrial [Neolecta irregularis DAH-3]